MVNIIVKEDSSLSTTTYDKLYVIVDKETGKILDNAQGYGYKSVQNAYAAWNYKNRDKSKDKEKVAKRKHIKQWLKEHKAFVKAMDTYAFEIAKGSWGSDDKFDAKFVKEMLKENNLEPDFTAAELLRVWKER